MDDVVGYAPVLVARCRRSSAASALPEGLAVVTTDDAPDAEAQLARFGTRAVVLRPDRHILGAADDAEEPRRPLRHRSLLPNPANLETL